MNLSAVILAGGASRRMGRDKAWLQVNGQPLLVHAARAIRALGIQELFISGRAGIDYSRVGCPVLLDAELDLGPLAGIGRALQAATNPCLLVLAVDMPGMTTSFLHKLTTWCTPLVGVVPRLNAELQPLAAIYPKRCHPLVLNCLVRGRRAAKEFALDCLRVKAVCLHSVASSDAGCFANWNHPSDITNGEAVS